MAATHPQLPAGARRHGGGVRRLPVLAGLAAGLLAGPAAAQTSCGSYDFATPFAAAFSAAIPFAEAGKANEAILSVADARCHQDQVIARLEPALGGRAGYKAAATSRGAQEMLGLDGPVVGVLFRDALLPDGARVKVDDGARLVFEQDLLVRVGSAAINGATTREEALAGLDAVIPFIELGDLMVPRGTRITGRLLTAMNAGARLGVMGEPIPLPPAPETADTLAAMETVLLKDGAEVARSTGAALLGHPLDAVLFIVKEANGRGWPLEPGDVLSLGSLTGIEPATPGAEVVARYEGLPGADGPVEISVTFE